LKLNKKFEKKTKIQKNNNAKVISITTKIYVIYKFIKLSRTQNWTKIMTKKIMQKKNIKKEIGMKNSYLNGVLYFVS
jgi:hypothetical protein